MSLVALNNFLVVRRQEEINRLLPTEVSRGRAVGYWKHVETSATLAEWVPTLFIYAGLVVILAAALAVGWGHHLGVYAALATAVNLVFFGSLEAVRKGPKIAPSLTRTSVLALQWQATSRPGS